MLPTEPVGVYSIFSDTKKGALLRDAFDRANKKWRTEEAFDKLAEKYLG